MKDKQGRKGLGKMPKRKKRTKEKDMQGKERDLAQVQRK